MNILKYNVVSIGVVWFCVRSSRGGRETKVSFFRWIYYALFVASLTERAVGSRPAVGTKVNVAEYI